MFTPEGELRPDFQPEEAPEAPKAAAPPPPPVEPGGGAASAAGVPPAEPAADRATSQAFVTLVSFLATNVYHALGIDPMTGKALSRRDTAAAQQMIEWPAILEQKTRGNLNFEETDLLSRALYELRMAYVEAVRPTGRAPPPRTGGSRPSEPCPPRVVPGFRLPPASSPRPADPVARRRAGARPGHSHAASASRPPRALSLALVRLPLGLLGER